MSTKIPDIALGRVVPFSVERGAALAERAKRAERRAKVSTVIAVVSPVVCTILGWLLGRFC